jgi:TatA/E family protein of Tat protein translocase
MGTIGFQEAFFIFILALVLFGPKKLPELGRTIGKAISEFRRASGELKASFEREMHNLERETEALKEPANTIATTPAIPSSYSDFNEYGFYDSYTEPNQIPASTTVSATEASGAESHGATETAAQEAPVPAVEGTVPRTEATPQHS